MQDDLRAKLRAFLKLCHGHAPYLHLQERLDGESENAGFAAWKELYCDLLQTYRDADLLVDGLTKDPIVPLDMYRRAVTIPRPLADLSL